MITEPSAVHRRLKLDFQKAVLPLRQWTVRFGQFMVHILLLLTCLQRGAAGLPTTAIFPPCSMNTPCPGMKLTLACRRGAEISPNRRDKNLIPSAPADREERESESNLGAVTSEVFYYPLAASRRRHAESLNAARLPTCLPILPVWRIKIHELR